ncbi:MAG: tRNA (N6-isopentenyl adenosine(37)-C2)-methylthiotransferase MiaB [Myxococcales bacterium]|nr:tRNA (N6-isopentenyl adenosine(37)-C2)-methylthiotransferase MiaB [Myxococcales bacterium]
MERRVFIETYGCQMNEADSELMFGLLRHRGWSVAPSADDADVVLLNTCAVRERAEERVFGRLGWLKSLKDRRPEVVLGVAGCMAERMRGQIVERAPYVDLVIGPDAYRRLPDLVDAAQDEDRADALIDVRLDKRETYADAEIDRVPGVSGWITVQRGCDKFCTFCIVPFVRGRERSLPPDEVVAQARAMAAEGFREVTLLGQTVSSYYERGHDFADLLSAVHDVEGLHRIRYTSPYPNDFSDRLLERLAALPRVGRHIHLPVQSGSTPMLRAMKRGYTAEAYRGLIDRVRRILPDFALSTDIIVGYPGETEADFEATLQLMRDVGFDSAFMFRYSEREGTFSARNVADDVPDEVKRERLQRLIALQEGISKVRYGAMVGRTVEVLVQGPSRRDPSRFIGRTSCFRTTILPEGDFAPGDLVPARVVAATSHTLFGEVTA